MSSTLKAALTTIAILAMAAAQVFGLSQGYVCYCDGAPVHVMVDHCHIEGDHCDSNAPTGQNGKEPHLVNELEVSMTVAMGHVQAPVVIMAILPDFLTPEIFSDLDEDTHKTWDTSYVLSGVPPASLLETASTVLLI